MTTAPSSPSYKGYQFPAEIISHAVWLYYRFSLSNRDVKELMAARDIVLSYETIRQWCRKFGQQYANQFVAVAKSATNGISMAQSQHSCPRAQ